MQRGCAASAGSAAWRNLTIDSEALHLLRTDDRWWLEARNGLTSMAIAVQAVDKPNILHLEVRRLHSDPNRRICHSPGHVPAMINSLCIHPRGRSCDVCRCLTHHSVVDDPHANATEIAFTAAKFSCIASNTLWYKHPIL